MGLLRHGSPAANRLLHSGFGKPCSAPRASGLPTARKRPTHSHGPSRKTAEDGRGACLVGRCSFFLLLRSSSLLSRRPWQVRIMACETKPEETWLTSSSSSVWATLLGLLGAAQKPGLEDLPHAHDAATRRPPWRSSLQNCGGPRPALSKLRKESRPRAAG